ncbi:MAG: hypothetical protein CMJ85_03250 [Planctomycetes bacterium]|nr:hypothetical protein [Planctomycetota bacterium]
MAFVTLSVHAQSRWLHSRHHFTCAGQAKSDRFGFASDTAGDFDADGQLDIVVGAWSVDLPGKVDAGRVRVLSGRDGSTIASFDGSAAREQFGFSVCGLGDLDGDGYSEIGVGAPGHASVAFDAGRVVVLSGKTHQQLHVWHGSRANFRFGSAVARVPDADSDGVPDLLVGVPGNDTNGRRAGGIRLVSVKTGKTIHLVSGRAAEDLFGAAVSGVGDLDKDGYGDFAVGAFKSDEKALNSGSVTVFTGRTGKVLFKLLGTYREGSFGNAVDKAGDVNRDGWPDIVVGSYTANTNLRWAGLVSVFSGKDGAFLWSGKGDKSKDHLGVSVAGIGDQNGDGYADVAAGAWGSDLGGTDAGLTRLYSGRNGTVLWDVKGDAGDELGASIAHVGDINGDGAPDFVTAAAQDSTLKKGPGYVSVLTLTEQFLRTDRCCLSLSCGGTQQMFLRPGVAYANQIFLMMGTASGTSPGVQVGALRVPINPDLYSAMLLANPNSFVSPSVGLFGSDGSARSRFWLPPNLDPALKNLVLHHAFVVVRPVPVLKFASNAASLRFR